MTNGLNALKPSK